MPDSEANATEEALSQDPPPTEDTKPPTVVDVAEEAIPHTRFEGPPSPPPPMPATDEYGIAPYELDPWDADDDGEKAAGSPSGLPHDGWVRKAEVEVCEKREWRQRDVQALREMVQAASPTLISPLDDAFLIRFLRAQKFDYERAFGMLKRYFLMRKSHPQNFARALPSAARHVFSQLQQTVLENRDAIGRRIFLFRAGIWDPYSVSPEDIFAANYLCLEMIARESKSQVAGLVMIVDMTGFSFSQVMHVTTEYVRSVANIIQNTFPLRFREIHIINESYLFDFVFALIKPFLSETIRNRIQFHGSNLTTLHEKIDPRILPREFGGKAGPMDNSAIVEAMLKREQMFKDLKNYGFNDEVESAEEALPESGSALPAPFQSYCMMTQPDD